MSTTTIVAHDPEFTDLEQTRDVLIFDKRIFTTVTALNKNADKWISNVESKNKANPLRLIVGLDLKLRTSPSQPTRLVLCVHRSCLIFDLTCAESVPSSLARFLSDRNNTFVGVGIESKFAQLQREYGLGVGARRADLGTLVAGRYNREDLEKAGLSELRIFLHGRDVERPPVPNDCNAVELSHDEQVHHACIDAYVCYELGSYIVYPIGKGKE